MVPVYVTFSLSLIVFGFWVPQLPRIQTSLSDQSHFNKTLQSLVRHELQGQYQLLLPSTLAWCSTIVRLSSLNISRNRNIDKTAVRTDPAHSHLQDPALRGYTRLLDEVELSGSDCLSPVLLSSCQPQVHWAGPERRLHVQGQLQPALHHRVTPGPRLWGE